MRAEHVGLQKGIGTGDGSVHVRFGGKVHQPGYRMLSQQAFNQSWGSNVTLDELEPRIGKSRSQTGEVPRVGQRIQHDDRVVRMLLQPVMGKVGADETRATRDQEVGQRGHRGKEEELILERQGNPPPIPGGEVGGDENFQGVEALTAISVGLGFSPE